MYVKLEPRDTSTPLLIDTTLGCTKPAVPLGIKTAISTVARVPESDLYVREEAVTFVTPSTKTTSTSAAVAFGAADGKLATMMVIVTAPTS